MPPDVLEEIDSWEVRITLQPWLGKIDSESGEALLDQVRAMLVLNNEVDRLLLILHYDSTLTLTLQDVTWRWISRKDISAEELPRILKLVEELRLRRLAKATLELRWAETIPALVAAAGSSRSDA